MDLIFFILCFWHFFILSPFISRTPCHPLVCISSWLCIQWCHTGSLKSWWEAFTYQTLINTINKFCWLFCCMACGSVICFCKLDLTRIHPLICILLMAAFILQWECWVVATETMTHSLKYVLCVLLRKSLLILGLDFKSDGENVNEQD